MGVVRPQVSDLAASALDQAVAASNFAELQQAVITLAQSNLRLERRSARLALLLRRMRGAG